MDVSFSLSGRIEFSGNPVEANPGIGLSLRGLYFEVDRVAEDRFAFRRDSLRP